MSFTRTKNSALALVILLLTVSACSAPSTPGLIPTPQTITLQRTESLSWLDPVFSTCVPDQSGVGLKIQSQPLSKLDQSTADITLRWGAPEQPSGYAAVLGSDEVVVIVPAENGISSLSAEQFKKVLNGNIRLWSELCPDCTNLPSGNIDLFVLSTDQDAYAVLSADLPFHETLSSYATLVPDPASMRMSVAADPQALGFVPARALDNTVRRVEITGVEQSAFDRDILAFSASEPQGALAELLSCVQQAIVP